MDVHAIPNDLLEVILLRLDYLCLHRAGSTCKQWRRIIADSGFLSRFRSLHGPPHACVYYDTSGNRWQLPYHASSPAAIDGRYFSLDFLPDSHARPRVWMIRDSRGSLLLLQRYDEEGDHGHRDLLICEPLTRRYEMIYTRRLVFSEKSNLIAYLLDGEAGGIGMSNFRLAFWLHSSSGYGGQPLRHDAAVLSSVGHQQHSLRKISIGEYACIPMGQTKSSVYWYTGERNVLALDKTTAEFSYSLLPDMEEWRRLPRGKINLGVTDGSDGEARIVFRGDDFKLKVFARLQDATGQWALERIIDLPVATQGLPGYQPWAFREPAFMETTRTALMVLSIGGRWWFRIDVETSEVERVSGYMDFPHPCELPWPPALRACAEFLDT